MSPQQLVIPDLVGKAVLITGASTGIGAAVALALARQGAKVAIGYHSSAEPALAAKAAIEAAGGEAIAIKGDVVATADCDRLVAETVAAFGRLDGLINNAGLMLGRISSLEASDDHVRQVIDLNATSVVAMTRSAVPFLERQGGFVINTTSIAARNGGGGGAVLYAAAKGFVSTLTRGQAKELIGKKIRVNAVAPGVIATPFHERYSDADMMETMRRTIPLGRVGTSEDCVGAYLFLASESLSGYIIGQVIEVNGGQLMP